MPAMTRGPLPSGIYWRRRLFVGLLALSLVLLVVNWIGGVSDGSSDEPAASQVGTVEEPTHTVTPDPSPKTQKNKKKKQQAEPELAVPKGRCADADVVVTPVVKQAVAGRPVTITLSLQTRTSDACHWRIGPQRVAVKISDDSGELWSTRHCKAIDGQNVVVRRTVATEVEFTWDARESDEGCPKATEWVLPSELSIAAAAFGGEPTRESFTLTAPKPPPKQKPKLQAQKNKGNALNRVNRD